MPNYCIGIDLGGTYVKFALLDEKRTASETLQLPTGVGGKQIVAQMVRGAKQLLETYELSTGEVIGVGIGSPGPLNLTDGIVVASPNIPGMENFPIRDRLSEGLGIEAVLENDANAAAYGEYLCGAGEGSGDMVLLTLGTGVGSGVIIDGKILHGSTQGGSEIGHMIVQPDGEQCGCGQRGCLERYCSATYLAQRTMRRIREENLSGALAEKLKQTGTIDAKDISDAAAAGDEIAVEAWDQCAYYLAIGCVNISRVFDPDEIVLGGGMGQAGEHLLKAVTEHFQKLHWSLTPALMKIELARLGNDAGAIGAAGVAWSAFGEK